MEINEAGNCLGRGAVRPRPPAWTRHAPAKSLPARKAPTHEALILVDARNRAVGQAGKQEVHTAGLLHRAFSIFLVDGDGRLLLQRRSRAKYHSGGLWANSCCGHPRPGERTHAAARRRLVEELGASARLHYAFRARYRTALANGLIENEIVYVYFGVAPARLAPNPAEVMGVATMGLRELHTDIARHPRRYAYWLRYYFKNHYAAIRRGVAAVRRRRESRVSVSAGSAR